MILSNGEVMVDGTYPAWSQWTTASIITPETAAQLLGLPAPVYRPCSMCERRRQQEADGAYFASPRSSCFICHGVGHETTVYMWMNKGLVLLPGQNIAPQPQGLTVALVAMLELIMDHPGTSGVRAGSTAVYLHDGEYSLIVHK